MKINGKDVDAYIDGKKIEHFVVDDMRVIRNNCSHTYQGVVNIGIDFAKRSDNVKYGMMFQPKTRAEETINWFLYGKKYQSAPQHFNCKCQAIPFKHISTEG